MHGYAWSHTTTSQDIDLVLPKYFCLSNQILIHIYFAHSRFRQDASGLMANYNWTNGHFEYTLVERMNAIILSWYHHLISIINWEIDGREGCLTRGVGGIRQNSNLDRNNWLWIFIHHFNVQLVDRTVTHHQQVRKQLQIDHISIEKPVTFYIHVC